MINVHERVDIMLNYILPEESVVDFGAGDCYLARKHELTRSLDWSSANKDIDIVCNLDYERPDISEDVAVMSGLLEWLEEPLALINWIFLNGRFKRAVFSYAVARGDPHWKYRVTIIEIIKLLIELRRNVFMFPWEGQYIFVVE